MKLIRRRLFLLIVLIALITACSGSSDDDSGERIDLDRVTPTSNAGEGDRSDSTNPDDAGDADDADDGDDGDDADDVDGPIEITDDVGDFVDQIPELRAEGREGYIEALTLNLELDPDNIPIFGDHAACVAEAWIDDIGVETFEANDISPQQLAEQTSMNAILGLDLSFEQTRAMMDELGDCDVQVLDAILRTPIFESGGADLDACLRSDLTEDMLLDSFAVELATDVDPEEATRIQGPILEIMERCQAAATE